jgi:hypothetical protein
MAVFKILTKSPKMCIAVISPGGPGRGVERDRGYVLARAQNELAGASRRRGWGEHASPSS